LRETLIEARAGREVYFEDIVERPWLEKGKARETMMNYFDMKTRNTRITLTRSSTRLTRKKLTKPNESRLIRGPLSRMAGVRCVDGTHRSPL
jgi:hypothetical protein